jgi:S1-C subfamily serine protease
MDVEPGSPGARAGLTPGDVIVRIGREAVTSAAEARQALAQVPAGSSAFLRVLRNGQENFVVVTRE